MFTSIIKNRFSLILLLAIFVVGANTLSAQTTEFTYQGRLTDNNLPANGSYDFEFRLFSIDTGGSALTGQQRLAVAVSDGVFTVKLNFSTQFSGANRYLEIAVKPAGGGSFTTLTPRQIINSAPYSVRSLQSTTADTANNATQLGGTDANQFVQTTDARLSDPRPPTTGSSNYIQNGTAVQSASDFNVSGSGTAGGTLKGNVVSATTQFNMGTSRVLFTDVGLNTFVGLGTGGTNTGGSNSFFGRFAGNANTTGAANAYFGRDAGKLNQSGSGNVFIGDHSGESSTTGDSNTFVGHDAGGTNTTGDSNTALGNGSNIFGGTLNNASAIGANARVTTNNSLVLGSINGINNATADTKVGIGTTAPTDRLTVKTATSSYGIVHTDGAITIGTYVGGTGVGGYFGTKSDHPLHFFTHDSSPRMTIDTSGKVGIGTTTPGTSLHVTGEIYIDSGALGLILKSGIQECWRLSVNNLGALNTSKITCP